MDAPSTSGAKDETFPVPKLKSVIAVFFGLFCILCFKKLIVFGRKWKNILIDWGYRSLNVPSLWCSDAIVDQTGQESPSSPSSRPGQAHKHTTPVPALRVPDAWSNFLLTWMHLNLNTLSSLIPAWISAINHELRRLCTEHVDRDGSYVESSTPYCELILENVRSSVSPPRLSSMETSASGSTKELHFHCTLSSPELLLEFTLRRTSQTTENEHASVDRFLVHLQQVVCRVKIVCAVLEGDYVLLSWNMVSPLLMQPVSLLDMQMQPFTKLPSSDARWIKDTVYLAIQSAVTRLVISPLCLTAVQQSGPSQNVPSSFSTPTTTLIKESLFDYDSEINLCPYPANSPLSNAMHLRVLYAVLLEPINLSSSDPLLTTPLRCRVRWNLTLSRAEDQVTDKSSGVLLTTSGVRLEPKTWPNDSDKYGKTFSNNRFSTTSSRLSTYSYIVVWNQDAYIPVTDISSSLLDVSLFTESNLNSASNTDSICGHAILPLPKLNDDPAKSQHVLLIDCYSGNPNDDWHTCVSKSPDVRAKFMLILRAQLFSNSGLVEKQSNENDVHMDCTQPFLSPALIAAPIRNCSTPTSLDSHDIAHSHLKGRSMYDNDPTANPYTTISTEQLAQFMSSPGTTRDLTFAHPSEKSNRRRSRSFGDESKVNQTTPGLIENQTMPHRMPYVTSGPLIEGKWANSDILVQHISPQLSADSSGSVQSTTAIVSKGSNNSLRTPVRSASDRKKDRRDFQKRLFLGRSLTKSWSRPPGAPNNYSPLSTSPSNITVESGGTLPSSASNKSRFRRFLRLASLRRKPTAPKESKTDRRTSG